jgi:hypothetical protein
MQSIAALSIVLKMPSSEMLRRVALVITDDSDEHIPSIVKLTRIGVLGITLTVCSAPKRRFLQDPHGVTSQKTAFFIVTATKTSNYISIVLVSNLI